MATRTIYLTVRLDLSNPDVDEITDDDVEESVRWIMNSETMGTMKSNRKSADKMTRAVFRKYPDGQIIALFPDIPWSEDGSVTSYMHVGQHGAAYYKQVIDSTTPASEEDYSALLAELETIGYDNLRIVKRK